MVAKVVLFALLGFLLISTLSSAHADQWYVDASVAESGDGTSWNTAFKEIQEGINAASDADTVIVAQGSYFQNIQLKGKNITLRSTDPLDPDVVANTVTGGDHGGETWKCLFFRK